MEYKLQQRNELLQQIRWVLESPDAFLLDLLEKESGYILVAAEYARGPQDCEEYTLRAVSVEIDGIGDEARLDFSRSNDVLEIVGVDCRPNSGWGSFLMERTLRIAKALHATSVWGWLSPVDLEDSQDPGHGSRLLHFYRKFGFEITDDREMGKRAKLRFV